MSHEPVTREGLQTLVLELERVLFRERAAARGLTDAQANEGDDEPEARDDRYAPAEVYELLFSAQHLEQLELMHEAVLTGVSQLDVETELGRLSKWQPNASEAPEA